MENLQAYFGDSPSVNELLAPDPRIQGGACRTLTGPTLTPDRSKVQPPPQEGRLDDLTGPRSNPPL